MRHITIHAEDEVKGRVSAQAAQYHQPLPIAHISKILQRQKVATDTYIMFTVNTAPIININIETCKCTGVFLLK